MLVFFIYIYQRLSPVSIPEHLEAEDEHDDDCGVVGVDGRDEGGDAEADQSRDDRHQVEGDDRTQKNGQPVVTHGKNGWNSKLRVMFTMLFF
jgi:hypothetical protein